MRFLVLVLSLSFGLSCAAEKKSVVKKARESIHKKHQELKEREAKAKADKDKRHPPRGL